MNRFRTAITGVPPWAWLAAVAAAALVVMSVNHWALHKEEGARWLDPEQPPLQIDSPAVTVAQRTRPYPGCLADWPDSVVGDC